MEEMLLSEALLSGLSEARKKGLWFTPNLTRLINELFGGKNQAGTLILPQGQSSYKLIDIPIHKIPKEQANPDSTADNLWECVKEHYGITAATAFLAPGAIPIPKPWLGRRVMEGASGFTNPISEFGLRFYPLKKIRYGTQLARNAKAIFGSIRVFGVLGRANAVGFIGFAILDVIALAACMGKK